MTTVETDRLRLRPWQAEDGPQLERLFSDPAVVGGRTLPPARIRALADHSLHQWRVNGFGPWAALDRATGEWIGRIGLDELAGWPGADRIEVGFELHQAWWGRGLATEGGRPPWPSGSSSTGCPASSASPPRPTPPPAG